MNPLLLIFLLAACSQPVTTSPPSPYPTGTPPPHADFRRPEAARLTGSYVCSGRPFELELRVIDHQVAVSAYQGSARAATATDLAQWNAWLRDLSRFDSFELGCTSAQVEWIRVRGAGPDGRPAEVGVFWYEGRLGRMP